MSKKKLYKSSDAIISGVCGGIAEYFGIDSTLVRIIAVALTIVMAGVPAILYVVCMIIMPPDPGRAQGYVDAHVESSHPERGKYYAHVGASTSSSAEPPPPDPSTRVSASFAQEEKGHSSTVSAVQTVRNHSPAVLVLGAFFIGIGTIALLCNFIHISIWRFWPMVLVVIGLVCLFTPGAKGWSLERAGNSIVLVTLGLALLAWMLQIVQTRVVVAAFRDLWPILLVVIGLSIIGSARKSSLVSLASSLVLSATILLGLWIYGGLDWGILGTTSFVIDSDGLHELIADMSSTP